MLDDQRIVFRRKRHNTEKYDTKCLFAVQTNWLSWSVCFIGCSPRRDCHSSPALHIGEIAIWSVGRICLEAQALREGRSYVFTTSGCVCKKRCKGILTTWRTTRTEETMFGKMFCSKLIGLVAHYHISPVSNGVMLIDGNVAMVHTQTRSSTHVNLPPPFQTGHRNGTIIGIRSWLDRTHSCDGNTTVGNFMCPCKALFKFCMCFVSLQSLHVGIVSHWAFSVGIRWNTARVCGGAAVPPLDSVVPHVHFQRVLHVYPTFLCTVSGIHRCPETVRRGIFLLMRYNKVRV